MALEFLEVVARMRWLQGRATMRELPCPERIVSANHASPIPEGKHPVAMLIGEQLVVDEGDAFLDHSPHELAVMGLLLDGVAEEEV